MSRDRLRTSDYLGETSMSSDSGGSEQLGHQQRQQQAATQALMNKSRDMIRKLTDDLSSERAHSQRIQTELSEVSTQLLEHRGLAADQGREIMLLQEKEVHLRQEIETSQANDEDAQGHLLQMEEQLKQREEELSAAFEFRERCELLSQEMQEHAQQAVVLQQGLDVKTQEHAELHQHHQQLTVEYTKSQKDLGDKEGALREKHQTIAAMELAAAALRQRLEAAVQAECEAKSTAGAVKVENERLGKLIRENANYLMRSFETAQASWSREMDLRVSTLNARVEKLKEQEIKVLSMVREANQKTKGTKAELALTREHSVELVQAGKDAARLVSELRGAAEVAQHDKADLQLQLQSTQAEMVAIQQSQKKQLKVINRRSEIETVAKEEYLQLEQHLMLEKQKLDNVSKRHADQQTHHTTALQNHSFEMVRLSDKLDRAKHKEAKNIKDMKRLKMSTQKALGEVVELQHRLQIEIQQKSDAEKAFATWKNDHKDKMTSAHEACAIEVRRLERKLLKQTSHREKAETEVQRTKERYAQLQALEGLYLEKTKQATQANQESKGFAHVLEKFIVQTTEEQASSQALNKTVLSKLEQLMKSQRAATISALPSSFVTGSPTLSTTEAWSGGGPPNEHVLSYQSVLDRILARDDVEFLRRRRHARDRDRDRDPRRRRRKGSSADGRRAATKHAHGRRSKHKTRSSRETRYSQDDTDAETRAVRSRSCRDEREPPGAPSTTHVVLHSHADDTITSLLQGVVGAANAGRKQPRSEKPAPSRRSKASTKATSVRDLEHESDVEH